MNRINPITGKVKNSKHKKVMTEKKSISETRFDDLPCCEAIEVFFGIFGIFICLYILVSGLVWIIQCFDPSSIGREEPFTLLGFYRHQIVGVIKTTIYFFKTIWTYII